MLNYKSVLLIISFTSIFFGSCKNDNKGPKANRLPDFALINQKEIKPAEIGPMRKEAVDIIDRLIKGKGTKAPTILESELWLFEAVVRDTSFVKQEDLGGAWIDFDENLKYTYGSFENQIGTGKYYYDFDNQIITLVDDNETVKPQEFKIINITDQMAVFQGEYRFRDNNMQSKLKRLSAKPSKQK